MCEDEGTRGGDGTAEAARCGIGGKGRGGLCQWFRWGGVNDKVGEALEEAGWRYGDMTEADRTK